MTDRDKLQKLFDAALRDPRETEKLKPTPAFFVPGQAQPETTQNPAPFQAAPVQAAPAQAVPFQAAPASPQGVFQAVPAQAAPATFQPMPGAAPAVFTPVPASAPVADLTTPMPNAGLDEATSAELGKMLDEQIVRKKRKERRDKLVLVALLLGLSGGGYGWFVQSPQRVEAFRSTMKEIRSAGDIAGIVATYKKSLEKVKVRSEQIDQATTSMGIDPTKVQDKDPSFEKEMREMMGEDGGKTVGERNRLLRDKFGNVEKTGKVGVPSAQPSAPASIPPR